MCFFFSGFHQPILFETSAGLDLRVPPPGTFTARTVERHCGPDKEIDVIDVTRQNNFKMPLGDFVDYFMESNKTKILNVLSLEFSDTSYVRFFNMYNLSFEFVLNNIYLIMQNVRIGAASVDGSTVGLGQSGLAVECSAFFTFSSKILYHVGRIVVHRFPHRFRRDDRVVPCDTRSKSFLHDSADCGEFENISAMVDISQAK